MAAPPQLGLSQAVTSGRPPRLAPRAEERALPVADAGPDPRGESCIITF